MAVYWYLLVDCVGRSLFFCDLLMSALRVFTLPDEYLLYVSQVTRRLLEWTVVDLMCFRY